MIEGTRIDVVLMSCGMEMSGPTHGSKRLIEGSRGDEIMLAEHFPILGDPSPPGFVSSWGTLPMFLYPSVGIQSVGGSFRVGLLPLSIQ